MNFNAYKYELFLKLLNDKVDDVKTQFETDQLEVDMRLNKFQWTPLQVAAHQGNMDLVSYFLNKGANKDYRNAGGFNAQMLADRKGFSEVSDFIERFIICEVEVHHSIED